ncbi:MAG: hypothetical protein LBU50_07585 [Cellulomonas sp.]|nr:hypothetical protein [Cellulomonas sp.]
MRSRTVSLLLGLVLGVGAVSGCTSDADDGADTTTVTAAPWAHEIATGEAMWTVSQDGWTLTAHDMGRDEAEQDSSVSDDVTGEPLVKKGDPIAFVNVVATNTSQTTMFVGSNQPGLWVMPMGSPYTQGVVGVAPASDSQMTDHDVWYHSRRSDAEESSPFTVSPGESFAMGFVLPLVLGEKGEWVFVPTLWVHETKEAVIGDELVFERQSHTFS